MMWQTAEAHKKVQQSYWNRGKAAPWICSLCYERDQVVVTPFDRYKNFGRYRVVTDVCPRCKRKLYGGVEENMGNGRWVSVCDLEVRWPSGLRRLFNIIL